ncbi:MAG: hypothetical protein EOM20_09240 [Spartobacteria bacterium]|nr:hypothetical protein [Spartobacteria bacterium]
MHQKQAQTEYIRPLTVLLGAGLLCALAKYLGEHYYIKAYSDPASWLHSGYLFVENFRTLHLPLGYPAYLWAMLRVLDPVLIFLANIPLLIVMALEIGWLAGLAAKEAANRTAAPFIGLLAMGFFLIYDPSVLAKLTNLYRDPLAHGLMLLSVIFFIRYLQGDGKRVGLLVASGLLLGFAYCTREPSIIIAAPMGLTGLVVARQKRMPLWKNILCFGGALLVGCLPVILQGLLSREQLSISPYAAHHGRMLPGLHLIAFPRTFPSARHYFTTGFKGFLTFAGLAGLVFALLRRNTIMSCLMAPCALMYFVLYSFYWNFFERYFFTVSLFLIPLAAYGVFHVVGLPFHFKRLRPLREPGIGILVTIPIIICGLILVKTPSTEPLFQVAQARALQQAIDTATPTNSIILCDRHNLGNTLFALTHRPYVNMDRLLYKQPWTDQAIREQLSLLTTNETPLFLLADDKPIATEIYQRHMNVHPVVRLRGADYHLDDYFGARELTLFRLTPWDRNRTQVELAPPKTPVTILWIDPLAHAGTQTIHAIVNGHPLPDLYAEGTHYLYHRFDTPAENVRIELRSDGPLPDSFPAGILPVDAPLDINLGFFSYPSHNHVFADYTAEHLAVHPLHLRLSGAGTVHLPTPWTNETWHTTWLLQNPGKDTPVILRIEGQTLTVPPGARPRPFPLIINRPAQPPHTDLHIEIISPSNTTPAFIDLDRILVAPR